MLAVAGLALVAALIGAAVIGSRRGTATFDEDRPEATVQRYLDALSQSRRVEALATFTDELAARCREQVVAGYYEAEVGRAVLQSTTIVGSTATVDVAIAQRVGGGPFDLDQSTTRVQFVVEQTDEGWRFADTPWPFYSCTALAPKAP